VLVDAAQELGGRRRTDRYPSHRTQRLADATLQGERDT
jgi:hypothetical protein